jgi:hypothetical protein
MNAAELEKFTDLYEKIACLKTVKCRLGHERIRYDKVTNLPFAECLPELGYKNIGFCSPEIRAERLACGHTMARYLLENALALLESNGVETENLRNDLREVTNKIHSLDHEKGFAEKHLAQLIEKKYAETENHLTDEIEKARFSIKEIEDFHSDCVEKIGKVRDSIIFEMQSFL